MATHTRGAWPKTAVKPTATIQAKPQPRRMPDLVDQIDEWIWVHISWEGRHPQWLKEFRALYWGCLVCNLDVAQVLHFPNGRLQPSGYQQPKRSMAGGAPCPALVAWEGEIFSLACLPTRIQGPGNIQVVRRDKTVGLAWALQWCAIWVGAPPGVLCSDVQDLCSCLVPLMGKGNLLSPSIWEVVEEEETTTSTIPVEETGSDEYPEPWEEWPTSVHAPDYLEEASLPKEAGSLRIMTIAWRWLPPAPHEFMESLVSESGLPPLEDAGSPLGIPQGAQLDLSFLGSMQVVMTQNTLTGEMWCHYQTRVISQTS